MLYAFNPRDGYASQFGQDRFVDQVIFKGRVGGVFLDVGANDGVTINNTYFLERYRGWTGICVEPLPDPFGQLQKNRTAVCVNACAGVADGETEFFKITGTYEMLSGRVETYEHANLERVRQATGDHPLTTEIVRTLCVTLPGILERAGLKHVDFVSLDTEGGELELLKTLDLRGLGVRAVTIENNFESPAIEKHMAGVGFVLVAVMGCDEIYERVAV